MTTKAAQTTPLDAPEAIPSVAKASQSREAGDDAIQRLLAIMAKLRDPQDGCPWDREQDFASIAPYTIEEAYEVADAIERADMAALKDELGDLLFQVVFHSRMAQERGAFAFDDVVEAVVAKMIRRHPHVFGDATIGNAAEQTISWEAIKAAERAGKAKRGDSVLDNVPLAAPALMRAEKMAKAAARIGFDWPSPEAVLEKLDEELAELKEASAGGDAAEILDEMGDVLFVCANLARKHGVDPEDALRRANEKFARRFRVVETRADASGRQCSLEELEGFWVEAKAAERKKG